MNATKRYLVPATEGLLVRDPLTHDFLPANGAMKSWTGPAGRYWRRRVKCGDCVIYWGRPPVVRKKHKTEKGGK